MPPPPSAASRDEPVIRDGGDACPGALRLHAADDGYLARVRLPAGRLSARQAALLGRAAAELGDGHLDLTSRGNVQLRGLAEGCGTALAALLAEAGLLPAPGHERVRNIVAGPLSGLDGSGRPDVQPWALEFDRLLCADARAAGLSGRFLFAFDDGRGDVAALEPDVTVLARRPSSGARALVRLGAADGAVEVPAADAARAALLAAGYFLDAVAAAGTKAWRVAELPAEHALDEGEFARRLIASGIPAAAVAAPDRPVGAPPRPGPAGGGERPALCALVPLGRLDPDQWAGLVGVADRCTGPLRFTPWRSVVLPGAPHDAPELLARAGLVTAPGGPWEAVTACTGRPGCTKSLADVRADARAAAGTVPGRPGRAALPVHWSGCERRCGHPRGTAWLDVVATPAGYEVTHRSAAGA